MSDPQGIQSEGRKEELLEQYTYLLMLFNLGLRPDVSQLQRVLGELLSFWEEIKNSTKEAQNERFKDWAYTQWSEDPKLAGARRRIDGSPQMTHRYHQAMQEYLRDPRRRYADELELQFGNLEEADQKMEDTQERLNDLSAQLAKLKLSDEDRDLIKRFEKLNQPETFDRGVRVVSLWIGRFLPNWKRGEHSPLGSRILTEGEGSRFQRRHADLQNQASPLELLSPRESEHLKQDARSAICNLEI